MKGDTIHLGDSIKRPTAILFWSTWLDASLQQASLIQRLKKELNGKVDFVAVSLDYNADEFKYRLGADTLAMDLVCDGLVWQSPAVLAYDVQTIPGNILLDKEGKVYARDVIHVELEKTIREMVECCLGAIADTIDVVDTLPNKYLSITDISRKYYARLNTYRRSQWPGCYGSDAGGQHHARRWFLYGRTP